MFKSESCLTSIVKPLQWAYDVDYLSIDEAPSVDVDPRGWRRIGEWMRRKNVPR